MSKLCKHGPKTKLCIEMMLPWYTNHKAVPKTTEDNYDQTSKQIKILGEGLH